MIKRKKKTCKGCGEMKYLFGHGYCDYCYKTQYTKPIKTQSETLKTLLAAYTPIKRKYLEEHPFCLAKVSKDCRRFSSEVHHRKGREGVLLIAVEFFLAVCRPCHDEIETMGKEVYEKGFKILRSTSN